VDAASQNDPTGSASQTGAQSKGVVTAIIGPLAGAVLTGIIAGSVLAGGAIQPRAPTVGSEIATVAPADLTGAAATLNPQSAGQLSAEARSCRAPLAVMTLSKAPGTQGGAVRIRSGSYLSPSFTVSDAAQRIAIPFPTPYATGHGQVTVEGAATGVQLTLTPTWSATTLQGMGVINLIWNTGKPCGK
jgi:hypothetical protein